MHDYPPSQPISGPHENKQNVRPIRTPSPTPSEMKELNSDVFDWKRLAKWRFWIRKEWIWYYLIFAIIITLVTLMSVYHQQIVHWLRPAADWLYKLPAGWLVPIAVLFVLSFPPLFGQEIVGVLCGVVWGLWVGFAIITAGTLLGEIGNYYAFKWCCRARGEKLEKDKIEYACLAKIVRDGGFWIALVARLSAIPGHFTTAVFSTCGMGIFTFTIAAILSMPKQFITVYLGVLMEESQDGQQSTKDKIISYVVLAVTVIVTVWSMWYIYHKMNQVKPEVIYLRRKARQEKMMRAAEDGEAYSYSTDALVPGRDVEAVEVELVAPRPLSFAHFEQQPGLLGVPETKEDENDVRTKVRHGRGTPSEGNPFEPIRRRTKSGDDQMPDSPFADPVRHDRDETFYTARSYSPQGRM